MHMAVNEACQHGSGPVESMTRGVPIQAHRGVFARLHDSVAHVGARHSLACMPSRVAHAVMYTVRAVCMPSRVRAKHLRRVVVLRLPTLHRRHRRMFSRLAT